MMEPKLKPMADAPSDRPVILYRQLPDVGRWNTLVIAFWSDELGAWVWPEDTSPIDFYDPVQRGDLVEIGDFDDAPSHHFIGWIDAPLAEGDQPQPPEGSGE